MQKQTSVNVLLSLKKQTTSTLSGRLRPKAKIRIFLYKRTFPDVLYVNKKTNLPEQTSIYSYWLTNYGTHICYYVCFIP